MGFAESDDQTNLTRALEELRTALSEYNRSLHSFYWEGSKTAPLREKAKAALESYAAAQALLSDERRTLIKRSFTRMLEEFTSERPIMDHLTEAVQRQTAEAQLFAAECVVFCTVQIGVVTAMYEKIRSVVSETLVLPTELESFRRAENRLKYWIALSIIALPLGLLGFVPLLSIPATAAGLLLLLFDWYWMGTRLLPGATLTGSVALQLAEYLANLQTRLSAVGAATVQLERRQILWPKRTKEVLEMLLANESVDPEVLLEHARELHKENESLSKLMREIRLEPANSTPASQDG
jgi:hypothetical protein